MERTADAHARLPHGDRANAGHDLALGQATVAHDAPMAIPGLRSACLVKNSVTSASTAWVNRAHAPVRKISAFSHSLGGKTTLAQGA
jgi:hypothetical protein